MSLEAAAHKGVHDALIAGSEAALAAYVDGRVYDRVPAAPPKYPYLVLDVDIRDDANTCSNASEVHATVHVYSAPPYPGRDIGSIEAKQIGGLVRKILAPDDGSINLTIEGYHIVVAAFDVAVYRPGDDPLLTEGVLTFTFLVDPTE